nr:reverse transcriptase domain-containing protein [Tanacetum cinerariifolium]
MSVYISGRAVVRKVLEFTPSVKVPAIPPGTDLYLNMKHDQKRAFKNEDVLSTVVDLKSAKLVWRKLKSIYDHEVSPQQDAATKAIRNDGNTMLHLVVEIGRNDFVEKLLNFIKDGEDIESKNLDGRVGKWVLRFSPSAKIQAIIPGTDLYLNKLAPSVGPKIFSTKEIVGRSSRRRRYGRTDDREETSPPLTKEHIKGHVSALKSLVKSHNQRNKGDPIHLEFKLKDTEVQDHNFVKGREVIDEDLRNPFKEARRTPLTRRIIEFAGLEYKIPNNIKLYDGTTHPEEHLSRFASAANSGEWPMPVWRRMFQQTLDRSARGWFERLPPDSINERADLREAFAARFSVRRACFKEPHEITKIIRRANESLTAFKERWTVETGFIMGVPEVMKISSFMDSVMSPELAKRFSDKVPTTGNERVQSQDILFIGRPGLKTLRAIPSTIHAIMKFPTPKGVATLVTRTLIITECKRLEKKQIVKPVTISRGLSEVGRDQLKCLLKDNMEVFAWVPADMTGVPRRIIEHALNVNPSLDLVCQKQRTFSMEKSRVVTNEVAEWVKAGIVRPMKYPTTLNEAKRNYAPKEKLALALIHMTRILRSYFEAHPVKVITDQPIKNILNNIETFEKLVKYHFELGAYSITFIPRNTMKGQVLADFLSEAPEGEKEELYFRMQKVPLEEDDTGSWTLFTDGASSLKGSGAGLVLIGPSGIEYTYVLRLTFPSTNNKAEYEALLAGLRIARQMNISNIEVKVDSRLVASQINRSYEASKDSMIKYLAKAKKYASGFKSFSIKNIPRNMNQKADVLSKLASVAFNHLMKEANYVIREIHMESCGIHVGPRVVVRKAIRQGYYWPTMHEDAKKEWGMDILRPLPPVKGGAKFVIMAIDYFTKWIEANLLVKITGKEMNTAVVHPQANGLVERANTNLIEGIKTHLMREKARWVDELPNVLWAHQTLIKKSNEETPFSLTYGSEAVIPAAIDIPTYRTLMIREEYNEEEMRLNLDLLQEMRETTVVREARYKTKIDQYYNKKVRPTCFRLEEFVFQRNEASMVEDQGKLGPKWEGSYRVVEAYENGSYRLQTLEDKEVPHTWHAINLHKCYM